MDQKEIILAGLTPANGVIHTPVQVQKLFFLLDKNIPELYGGPLFDFQPYNYGPFDKAVYDVLRELTIEGYVDIIPQGSLTCYKLTASGQKEGEKLLSELPQSARKFIEEVSVFVRRLSFTQLVSAIYEIYPEMRANSVFQG